MNKFINILRKILNIRVHILDFVIRRFFLTNRHWYNGICYNTDHRLVLFLKNFVRPNRFLLKLIYGQVIPMPFFMTLASPPAKENGVSSEQVGELVKTLRKDGIVWVRGRYKEVAERIRKTYDLYPEKLRTSPNYISCVINPQEDQQVFDFWADGLYLNVARDYFRSQPYFRLVPKTMVCYPDRNRQEARGQNSNFANEWHYDTPNQLCIHLFLSDVDHRSTRMLFARETHRRHHRDISKLDKFFTDAYIEDHYEVVQCVGQLGDLFLFDSNGIHRAEAVKNSFRAEFHTHFTPGNTIVKIETFLEDETDAYYVHPNARRGLWGKINPLSPLQEKALSKLKS